MRGWNFETSLRKHALPNWSSSRIVIYIKSEACLLIWSILFCCFSRSETFINFFVSDQQDFVKPEMFAVMTPLWRNDIVTCQLNYIKLINFLFSFSPPNSIPICSIVLEIWATGTSPRAQAPLLPPKKSPGRIGLTPVEESVN